jgi:protease-4
MDDPQLARVSDGRVFTGRQGVELKLVDELGDEKSAVAWLAKEKKIDAKTPVRDYKLEPRFGDLPFLHVAAVALLQSVGLSGLAHRLDTWSSIQAMEQLNLDGLLALWHPPTAQ